MSYEKISLKKHKELAGKIGIASKVKIKTVGDLAAYYTPGVAAVSKKIAEKPCRVWDYTMRGNTVAVVSDGSAVLGLGNIGPEAAHPVMAGKALLFKEFADIDAFPICLATQDSPKIIETCRYLAPSFGGINLEDISAPRCFEIESALQDLGIPVMHDDQHGTAVVVLAGLINAVRLVNKKLEKCQIVINGLGAAGTAVALIINKYTSGRANIRLVDSQGLVCARKNLGSVKGKICRILNSPAMKGGLKEAVKSADIFIGLSVPNVLTSEMVKSMSERAIVFALSNPIPEIDPRQARQAGAAIVATGRSDYPNQVNNVLAFPGIFRGALDARATKITEKMKLAAAEALAETAGRPARRSPDCRSGSLGAGGFSPERILPSPLEKKVVRKIAAAVKSAAIGEGVVRPICR